MDRCVVLMSAGVARGWCGAGACSVGVVGAQRNVDFGEKAIRHREAGGKASVRGAARAGRCRLWTVGGVCGVNDAGAWVRCRVPVGNLSMWCAHGVRFLRDA